jgi:hypothetical protein
MENASSEPATVTPLAKVLGPYLRKLLAGTWGVLALLLLIAFLLPNYRIATLDKNGFDVVDLLFQDTSHLREITNDSSYLLMVTVPISYLLLAAVALFAAVKLYLGKGDELSMVVTGAAAVVLILTIIGLYTIGSDGREVPFFGKLMPRPVLGYHLAIVWEAITLSAGVIYHVIRLQNAARMSK